MRVSSRLTMPLAAAACGLVSLLGLACPAQAAVHTYDVAMKCNAQHVDGNKSKLSVTGTLTWDDETGAISLDLTEASGLKLSGAGLLGTDKVAIGSTTLKGVDPEEVTVFNGTAFFTGKFSQNNAKFNGKITAVLALTGAGPDGLLNTTGTVKATRRANPEAR